MTTHRAISAAAFAYALAFATPSHADATDCSSRQPVIARKATSRPISAEDIASLRDVGVDGSSWFETKTLSLSPDGGKVAFQVRRADTDSNRYCLEMVMLDLHRSGSVTTIDSGGDHLRVSFDFRGKAAFPSGNPLPIEPQWSSDGRWIAFLKREGGITQVWRAGIGMASEPITTSGADVQRFHLSADGRTIIYTTRPGLEKAQLELRNEGLHGFRYDGRFSPMSRNRPFPSATIPTKTYVRDLLTGAVRSASDIEKKQLSVGNEALDVSSSEDISISRRGERAWRTKGAGLLPNYTLTVQTRGNAEIQCQASACTGRISKPWWSADGTKVRFFRREGWGFSSTGLYEWRPGSDVPRRIIETDETLSACQPINDELLCLRESAMVPRQIVLLAPNGTTRLVYDPNPEFANLQLGKAKTLHWTNSFGVESYGHLILPVGYRQNTRYPLIVVGYNDYGFLRGGTGDEYPIQAFAARGYAVLSYNKPRMLGLQDGVKDYFEVERINLKGFQDRRSILSTIETAVRTVIADGIADPQRIGLTGFSDGVSTAQFAILHSKLFAAVALSHGSWESAYPIFVGPDSMKDFEAATYPRLSDDRPDFWREFSLRPNAAHISTPILMQVPDDEYLSDLEGFTALRELGKPVDLFVFPDEHHVKWQPAHRLAIYRRNLDWFDYWLKGVRSPASDRQSDLKHWDDLRLALAPQPTSPENPSQ